MLKMFMFYLEGIWYDSKEGEEGGVGGFMNIMFGNHRDRTSLLYTTECQIQGHLTSQELELHYMQ